MFEQRDIVMVAFELKQGVQYHPAIIISNNAIHEIEGVYYCVMCSSEIKPMEFSLELTPEMIIGGKPMLKTTYIKTHLLQPYLPTEFNKPKIGKLTIPAFELLKQKINETLFDLN